MAHRTDDYEARANILLVDDRPQNLVALEAILEPLGQRLVRAQSGTEALKHLLTQDFAVILLDVQMPVLDGFETAALIKQRERTRHVPIIFITAISTDAKYVFQGYSAGAVDYLAKPFDADILKSKVSVFIELFRKGEQIKRQAELLRLAELREAERRRAERERAQQLRHLTELADSEARLRRFKATLDATLDGVFIFEPDTLRLVYANQGALVQLGYTRDEIETLTLPDIMPEMDADRLGAILAPLVAGQAISHTDETFHRCRDGTEIPVEVCLQWVVPGGQAGQFVSVARDITERRQAQAALAQAYDREKRIATILQGSLLLAPSEDGFPGLSIATRYEPAVDEALVGGDFFDAFALSGDRVALVVGDVTGKGLVAAARTAEVKYALRAFLRDSPHPSDALSRLNDVLCETYRSNALGQDTFICLSLAVIAPGSGEVLFAGAGAEPPLVLRADGTVQVAESYGLPLGVAPHTDYQAVSMCLASGDMIVQVTDGITEARSGGSLLGYGGMTRAAQEALSLRTPQLIGQAILDTARQFAGGKLQDDACLLLAYRN